MRSRLVLVLAGAAALAGCATDPSSEIPESAQVLASQPLPAAQQLRFYSGMTARERLVIRDDATWSATWRSIVGSQQPPPEVPKVDFATSVVIVAAMGQRNTGGYSIDVDQVSALAQNAWISVTESSPGSTCVVTDALTAPVSVVVAARFAGKATFVEHTATRDCQ